MRAAACLPASLPACVLFHLLVLVFVAAVVVVVAAFDSQQADGELFACSTCSVCVCVLCIFRDAFSIGITQNESQQLNFGSAGRQRRRRRREEGHRECLIICLRYFLICSAKYRSRRQTLTCGLSSDNNSWHRQQGEMLPTERERKKHACIFKHFGEGSSTSCLAVVTGKGSRQQKILWLCINNNADRTRRNYYLRKCCHLFTTNTDSTHCILWVLT